MEGSRSVLLDRQHHRLGSNLYIITPPLGVHLLVFHSLCTSKVLYLEAKD